MIFRPLASSSRGNCYLAESPGVAPLLIECGIPAKQIREKLNFSLSGLSGCIVSHAHGDHSKAVGDLLKSGVDVYLSKMAAEDLGVEDHYRVLHLSPGRKEAIGDWAVLPFDVHHDTPTQGFVIVAPDGDNLLFVPDTAYLRNRFNGASIIAVECNYIGDILSGNIQKGAIPRAVGRRVRRSHMSLDTVIGLLKANDLSRCREIWLLHLSDANSNEADMRRKVQETTGIATYIAGSQT